jgi:hypothetical protein
MTRHPSRCPAFKFAKVSKTKKSTSLDLSSSLVSDAVTALPTELDLPPAPESEMDLPSNADVTNNTTPGLLQLPELSSISNHFRLLRAACDIVCLACKVVLPHQRIKGHLVECRDAHKQCKMSECQYSDLVDALEFHKVPATTRTAYYLGRQFEGPIPGVDVVIGFKCNLCVEKCFISRTLNGLATHQRDKHRDDARRLSKESAKYEEVAFQIVYEQDHLTTRYRVAAALDKYHRERTMAVDMQPHLERFRELGDLTRYSSHI